jgi:hypothetical protein
MGQHHNNHLQNAYHKYGRLSFFFEILESEIKQEFVNERERYWIEHFNSFHSGFNLTSGGSDYGRGKQNPCTWNGITYVSMAEAARANNIDFVGMLNRIKRGHSCDSDLWKQHKPCIWNGIEYCTIAEAARANNINKSAMCERIKKGYTCDADVYPFYNGKPCIWNGIEYRSIQDAARVNNVSSDTMYKRLESGYVCDNDLRWIGGYRECIWNGISYPTVKAASLANNIIYTTFVRYVNMGLKSDSDVISMRKNGLISRSVTRKPNTAR